MRISDLFPKEGNKSVMFVLRIVLAIIFSLTAFIFSDVITEIPPFNRTFLRVLITLWFGIIGYTIFPDLARVVSTQTLNLINTFISRISNEIMSQFMKLPQANPFHPPYTTGGPVGGVSVSHPMIIDTSAIIDGRILDIAKTGFLYGTILVPAFVLAELQQVADSADYIKRSRGRRGFDIMSELKKTKGIRIEIWDKEVAAKTVDDKLLKLAKGLNGRIITTDFNLNKVASISGVTVLNINDLANSLKTVAIPGEKLTVKVVHLGKDPTQGVGYLPDGTMIVVENGAEMVGKEIKTEVARVLQVSAGKMIFVKAS